MRHYLKAVEMLRKIYETRGYLFTAAMIRVEREATQDEIDRENFFYGDI